MEPEMWVAGGLGKRNYVRAKEAVKGSQGTSPGNV